MMDRIAIMGTGSLGTILGAYIAKSGRQVDLIDANKAHVDALNKNGARVIGNVEMTVPVHALTPDEMEGTYDLFIYLAKQTYNDVAIPQMIAHSHDKTIICTGQNGLPEPEITKVFDPNRVLGAPVGWGATWVEPGVSRLTQDASQLTFTLGSITGEITPAVEETKKILELMGHVTISKNLIGLRWCKVLMNATFSGMSAAMGTTFGGVMDDPIGIKCVAYIGRECIRAVAASGVKMEPFHGKDEDTDFNVVFDFSDEESRKKTEEACRQLWGGSRALEASMLQDLQKGRKCEIDAINGVVCKCGRENGVPTPINDKVVEIVKLKEAGKLPVDSRNLEKFVFDE